MNFKSSENIVSNLLMSLIIFKNNLKYIYYKNNKHNLYFKSLNKLLIFKNNFKFKKSIN